MTDKTISPPNMEQLDQRLAKIEDNLSLLLRAIVVQQKDAVQIAGVSPDTPRNKFLAGDIDVLSRDGSRLNYLTLQTAGQLKRRTRRK